jgi:hypothetical protein
MTLARIDEFSLQGGPLYRLAARLGLVRDKTNTVALGFALGLFLWCVLLLLALIGGVGYKLFSLSLIGGHIRLLVAIPLFFICESMLDPRMTAFVRTIVQSGIVPQRALPALESEVARITRWQESRLPDTLCLFVAVVFSWYSPQMNLPGITSANDMSHTAMAAQWYWTVCMPIFRFLILRWLWRLGLWCFFLWRMVRLDLRLVPTHPDGAAGLGGLEIVHAHFSPLVLAISVIQAASLAEEISIGTSSIEAIYPALTLILAIDAALFLGPLLIPARKLWACQVKGLSDYMAFASLYVSDFDKKWVGTDAPPGNLLGTADLQSLADLGNSIAVVRNMRWIPVSMQLMKEFALAAVLPFLPLLLLKYPVSELAEKFFIRLSGL